MIHRAGSTSARWPVAQIYIFLVEKDIFTILAYELFKVKMKIVNNTRNTYIWVKIPLNFVVR